MKIETPVCPICKSPELERIITIDKVPVFCNVLYSNRAAAQDAPTGTLDLRVCSHCTHVYNFAFDPDMIAYEPSYENALHFSSAFRDYADALARRLVHSYALHGHTGIEIGCGDGYFLNLLCSHGLGRGIGFDPSLPENSRAEKGNHITFIRDYYSAEYRSLSAKCICMRHVLEHIPHPSTFLAELSAFAPNEEIDLHFCEVPNGLFTFQGDGFWDLIFEHCSYFTPQSLRYLYEHSGYGISSVQRAFGDQFLSIDAHPGTQSASGFSDYSIKKTLAPFEQFSDRFYDTVHRWMADLRSWQANGKSVAIWGAGSKGATFLNVADTDRSVQWAVDINTRKENKYIPVTAQRVVAPSQLQSLRPDILIIMNDNYRTEIQEQLQTLGVFPEIRSVAAEKAYGRITV